MPVPTREPKPVDRERFDAFTAELDALRDQRPDRPLILYTSFSFSHNYLKLLRQLKKAGASVAVMLADGRMCNSVPMDAEEMKEFYDAFYVSDSYLRELPLMAQSRPFDAIHASVGTGSPYVYAKLIEVSGSPVIIDYFDFREIMFDTPEDFARYFGVRDFDLEMKLWRDVFTGASGVIHLDSPELFELLVQRHGYRPKAIHFLSYIDDGWLAENRAARVHPVKTPPKRLVFTGGLHNNPSSHCFAVQDQMMRNARIALGQGFDFTVVNGCDATGQGFEHYLRLQEENPNFHYLAAMDNRQLSRFLTSFDLGWFYEDRQFASESELYSRTLMGSKLFNYMEAGLPVLASDTCSYLASFIREHNIGLVLDDDGFKNLGECIRQADWDSIMDGVRRAQSDLAMSAQAPRLIGFYNDVCGKTVLRPSGGDR